MGHSKWRIGVLTLVGARSCEAMGTDAVLSVVPLRTLFVIAVSVEVNFWRMRDQPLVQEMCDEMVVEFSA